MSSRSSKAPSGRSDRKRRIEEAKRRERLTGFAVVAVLIILVGAGAGYYVLTHPLVLHGSTGSSPCDGFPFPRVEVERRHDHLQLLIFIDGKQMNLPVNIGDGDSGACIQPLHVHADSPNTNVIHIESPTFTDYTLGDFFNIWAHTPKIGGPTPVILTPNQIFSYRTGNGYELHMYVDGSESDAFGSLVLHRHNTIVIAYGKSSTDWSYYRNLSTQPWPYEGY